MERRYQARLDELLDDAEVRPGLLRGLLPRLEAFLEPFVRSLCCCEQRTNAQHYASGLLPDLASKDAESIAYLHDRERRNEAGVPREVRFATRHELALEMLDLQGSLLPHRWVAGDDEMGRSTWFRQQLRQRGERYLLAVPSNTLVRDLVAADPPYSGQGWRKKVPFLRADEWRAALAEDAWQTVDVRDGEKGPLLTQVAWTLVQARTEGKASDVAEPLLVFREQQSDGSWKHDYLLSNEIADGPPVEMAWPYKAEHRIEESIKQAKGEAGLADYQVRTWEGWHHHQCLSLLASWFLTEEARRGKKTDAGPDGPCAARDDSRGDRAGAESPQPRTASTHREPPAAPQRGGPPLPLATAQTLAAASL